MGRNGTAGAKNWQPKEGVLYRSPLVGHSNHEEIPHGSTLFWQVEPYDSIEKGDYVFYRKRDGGITMHRADEWIDEGEGKGFWKVKGASNRHRDAGGIWPENFLGKLVRWKGPDGGGEMAKE